MISLKNVYKEYSHKKNTTTALNNISLDLPDKGLIFITGKSGSGKTTLLNILGCLTNPTKGSIYIDNKNVTKLKENKLTKLRNKYIGFVFQDFNLLEDLNVYDNIAVSSFKQNLYQI